jgi:hypothetical protein
MRKFIKNWVILFTIFSFLFVIGLEIASSQQYFTLVGSVINIYRGNISVKGAKGEVMNFAVGRRTVYIPSRLPGIGERVKVSYYFQRGYNVAYQVEILPPPPPPKTK